MHVDDVAPNGYTLDRAAVRQKKTGRPVRFELTEQTRQAIDEVSRADLQEAGRVPVCRSLRRRSWPHDTSVRPPCRPVDRQYRPRSAQVRHALPAPNQSDADLSANRQPALGHTKIESTVRYLGIEVDDAIEIAEKSEVRGLSLPCSGDVGSTVASRCRRAAPRSTFGSTFG